MFRTQVFFFLKVKFIFILYLILSYADKTFVASFPFPIAPLIVSLLLDGAIIYDMGVGGGGMGGIYPPPKDLHTSGQNWLGGVWQFFPRSKKTFRRNRRPFFFFARRRRTFWELGGVYTPPPPAGGRYPPNGKNVPMSTVFRVRT